MSGGHLGSGSVPRPIHKIRGLPKAETRASDCVEVQPKLFAAGGGRENRRQGINARDCVGTGHPRNDRTYTKAASERVPRGETQNLVGHDLRGEVIGHADILVHE